MSGSNPFRRSKILAASEGLPSIPDSSGDAIRAPNLLNNVGVFDPDPNPHSKTARIATPPVPTAESSRSYFPAAPTTTTTTTTATTATRALYSPPPPPRTDESDSSDESTADDPFNPHASAVDRRNNNNNNIDNDDRTGSEPRYQRSTSQNATLAVSDQGSHLSVPTEAQGRGLEEAGIEPKRRSTAALDVDAFTRLLLTGNAEELSEPKKTAIARIDTASDLSTPASQIDKDNGDIENSAAASQRIHPDNFGASVRSLRAESNDNIQRTASVKRPKPPPPKTRHGKPIKTEEPQQSSRKSSAEGYPSGESSQKPVYPKTSILSPPSMSDYREEMAAALEANPSSNSSDSGINDDVSSLHRASPQSKRPPTPPLARRHSQLKPNKTPQPRAQDKLHRISLPPRGLGLQIPGPPSPGFKTPPRPPSRRHGEPLAGSQTDSSSQLKSCLSQDHAAAPSPNFAVDEPSSTESSSPPSRQPSIKRSSSGSAANMPPPPPPPRRARTSSKGSLNNPAPASLQTKTTDDRTESEPQPSSHAKDILADLSRLQQEVDSLRGHYENRKVSE